MRQESQSFCQLVITVCTFMTSSVWRSYSTLRALANCDTTPVRQVGEGIKQQQNSPGTGLQLPLAGVGAAAWGRSRRRASDAVGNINPCRRSWRGQHEITPAEICSLCIWRMTTNATEPHWPHGAWFGFGLLSTRIRLKLALKGHFLKKALPRLTKPQMSTL